MGISKHELVNNTFVTIYKLYIYIYILHNMYGFIAPYYLSAGFSGMIQVGVVTEMTDVIDDA